MECSDKTLLAHESKLAGIETKLDMLQQDMSAILRLLNGNGHPGLIARLTILETEKQTSVKFFSVAFSVLCGLTGFLLNPLMRLIVGKLSGE